ncbi:MAG: DMT family transporter [Planctomycetota bacterium]
MKAPATTGKGLAIAALSAQTMFSAATFLLVKRVLGTPSQPGVLSAFQLLTLRFAIAGGVLGILLINSKGTLAAIRRYFLRFLLLGFIAVPLNVGLFFEGASRTPAAHSALAYALTPVFVFIYEKFAGRVDATFSRAAGILLALGGALTVLLSKHQFSGPEPVGDLMLLGAAASWGLYTVLVRPLVATVGAMPAMVSSLLLGSILWLPAGIPIALNIDYAPLDAMDWIAVLYTAAVTTIISYLLWLYALKRLDATQVAVFTNLQPVATVFLAWIVLGEPVTAAIAGATTLVLCGVTLVQWNPRLPSFRVWNR